MLKDICAPWQNCHASGRRSQKQLRIMQLVSHLPDSCRMPVRHQLWWKAFQRWSNTWRISNLKGIRRNVYGATHCKPWISSFGLCSQALKICWASWSLPILQPKEKTFGFWRLMPSLNPSKGPWPNTFEQAEVSLQKLSNSSFSRQMPRPNAKSHVEIFCSSVHVTRLSPGNYRATYAVGDSNAALDMHPQSLNAAVEGFLAPTLLCCSMLFSQQGTELQRCLFGILFFQVTVWDDCMYTPACWSNSRCSNSLMVETERNSFAGFASSKLCISLQLRRLSAVSFWTVRMSSTAVWRLRSSGPGPPAGKRTSASQVLPAPF